ncbi:hypothetical protein [Brevibacillus sp. HD1.4A]|uniref:phage neck terminator protein n=1 Tax=Brevibacillus sp. HD1.4A TaxID=2738978 RepID=UPI00156BA4FE|nr:hypothetical protein [Brevibacillus sp. HD1.4A]NRQ51985.1 hypothetical protein [Brevibacillus sp. HD1.4A]
MQVLSLTQIENIFWNYTMKSLGLDTTKKENQKRIRIGYQPEGAPAWKRTDNVGFILVTTTGDPITQQTEITYARENDETALRSASYIRVIQVTWTFYGPNSFDDADKVRSDLLVNPLNYAPLALVTDVPPPFRLPELFEGQWWERSIFTARFNELVVRTSTVNYIKSVDVQVISNR